MKLAINHRPVSFSDRWIEYCEKFDIPYKIVNCFHSDIVSQLDGCDGLMWSFSIYDYKHLVGSKELIFALHKKGIKTFPDIDTCWHYDDKLGQKYLLEAINAPFVPSYVFYTKNDAIQWINSTTFPKVFKLRGGAGSVNVKLVKNKRKATRLVKKSFSGGFSRFCRMAYLKDQIRKFQENKNRENLRCLLVNIIRLFVPNQNEKLTPREKGYVYFQDFIPDNKYDTRLVVIGNRCFGIRRYNRDNDFRASGSGKFYYDTELIDNKCIKLAFELSKKLKTQCMAFDFLYHKGEYKVVEMCYAFPREVFYKCPGYWDENLNWHDDDVIPQYYMIEDFISSLKPKEQAIELSHVH
jgi:glutathione synthase/RimK-type ligase-like ATP-grasp enzyme